MACQRDCKQADEFKSKLLSCFTAEEKKLFKLRDKLGIYEIPAVLMKAVGGGWYLRVAPQFRKRLKEKITLTANEQKSIRYEKSQLQIIPGSESLD
jgi:hypothetical protein